MNQSLPAEYFQLFRNDFLLLSRDSADGIIVVHSRPDTLYSPLHPLTEVPL